MTDEDKRAWLRPIISLGLQSVRHPYLDSPRPYYAEQVEGVIDALIKSGVTHELFETIAKLKAENTVLNERLSKSVELPRVETSLYDENDSLLYYIENDHIQCECFNNKFPEQLENKLKELRETKE